MLIFEICRADSDVAGELIVDASANGEGRIGVGLIGNEAGVVKTASAGQEFGVGYPSAPELIGDPWTAQKVLLRDSFART